MKQLQITFHQLTGPSRDELRKLFQSSQYLKLLESLRLNELKLSHEVGSLIRLRGGQPDFAAPGLAEKLSDLEKVRNTVEILERLSEPEGPLELLTRQNTVA